MTGNVDSMEFSNVTGVVRSKMHVDYDTQEAIIEETMPVQHVNQILSYAQAMRDQDTKAKQSKYGRLAATIPITLYWKWQREWEKMGKAWGVTFESYVKKMLNTDHQKFLIEDFRTTRKR